MWSKRIGIWVYLKQYGRASFRFLTAPFYPSSCRKQAGVRAILSVHRYMKPQGNLMLKSINVSGKFNEFLLAVNLLNILKLFSRTL
jgi:hypothetical protein